MVTDPIQTSFLGGEISESLRGQVDSPLYKQGLAYDENFMPRTQGSIITRPGSVNVDVVGMLKLAGFRTSHGDDYVFGMKANGADDVIGVGDIIDRKGTVKRFGPNTMPPTFGFGAADTNKWIITGGAPTIAPVVSPDPPPPGGGNVLKMTTGDKVQFTCGIQLGPTGTNGGMYLLRFYSSQKIVSGTSGNVAVNCKVGWSGPGSSELYNGPLVGLGYAWADSMRGLKLAFGGIDDEYMNTLYVELSASKWQGGLADGVVWFANMQMRQVESTHPFPLPWSPAQFDQLQWVADTGKDRIIFVHPEVKPYVLERFDFPRDSRGAVLASAKTLIGYQANAPENTLPQDWRLEPATFTGQPPEWMDGNYPGVVELYQGRMWLAGTPLDLNKFWASKSGSIFDFTIPVVSPTVAYTMADAFTFDIQTKGAICWFKGKQKMLCGTDMGDYSITSQGGVVWAADIQVKLESNYGSAKMMAIAAGDQVLYVSTDRRKIHAINFDLNTDSWQSLDITFTGEHLVHARIKEFCFARDPYRLLICRLDDDTVVICTYARERQAAAWWRWTHVRFDKTLALATSDGPTGTTMWASRFDSVNGLDYRLEYTPFGEDDICLDSRTEQGPVLVGNFITLWKRDSGNPVGVFIDGKYKTTLRAGDPDYVIQGPVTSVITGDVIYPKARTLKPESGGRRGTSQGLKQRWAKVCLRVMNSALPLINGERAQAARNTAFVMGEAPPLYTGDTAMVNLGWEEDGELTIEQDVPFRTEILAVFGVLAGNED